MLPFHTLIDVLARSFPAWSLLTPVAPAQAVIQATPAAVPQAPSALTWVDMNGDDLPDLFVAQSGGDRLLINRGGGLFEERIASSGLGEGAGSLLALWADFDVDRQPDVYRVGADRVGGLWRNMGDGTFAQVSEFVGLPPARDVLEARWIDVDGDPYPDLEVVCLEGATVYRNASGRGFEPALSLPLRPAGASTSEEVLRAGAPHEGLPPGGARGSGATALPGPTVTGTSPMGGRPSTRATPFCAFGVQDQAVSGGCITASSVPSLGQLYPLSNNLFVSLSGFVGIGTTSPASELDVLGKTRTEALQVIGGASSGHVLTSDASGNASWQPVPGGGVGGSGTSGYMPKFTSATTLGNSAIYDNSGRVGIGVINPILSTLHLKSWMMDASLRLEGTGTDGVGGRLAFGESDLATYIEEDIDDGLILVAGTGIAMGPGNVGIHTASHADATHALTVSYKDLSQRDILRLVGPDGSFGHGARLNFGDGDYVQMAEDEDDHLGIRARLGTRVTTPGTVAVPALEVIQDVGSGTSSPALKLENTSTAQGIGVFSVTNGSDANAVFTQNGSGSLMRGFIGGALKFEVRNDGRVVCRSLEITGGSDLVEAFESDVEVVPGTVMCIDPDRPGQLTPSFGAYDTRVAGVVSGAGGVEPGLHLRQEGVVDGDVLVAMTGRVYVRCSTENGAIRAGDLLTTASVAGHAMRASDPGSSFGSVIGKAMGTLDEGTGLVLVLVNLQ